MSIPELKNLLHRTIALTEDVEVLERLLAAISAEGDDLQSVITLSQEDIASIDRGLQEIKLGKGISHEGMIKKYASWR